MDMDYSAPRLCVPHSAASCTTARSSSKMSPMHIQHIRMLELDFKVVQDWHATHHIPQNLMNQSMYTVDSCMVLALVGGISNY